ncbi:uncharacterized protein [Periplaneta americana]|uniref:uncharacterized protein n=1 Tax=Periplaneta americana TaxID=6978 RepID=UPI0037E73321
MMQGKKEKKRRLMTTGSMKVETTNLPGSDETKSLVDLQTSVERENTIYRSTNIDANSANEEETTGKQARPMMVNAASQTSSSDYLEEIIRQEEIGQEEIIRQEEIGQEEIGQEEITRLENIIRKKSLKKLFELELHLNYFQYEGYEGTVTVYILSSGSFSYAQVNSVHKCRRL